MTKLEKLRTHLNLTQEAFAKSFKLDLEQLKDWEENDTAPVYYVELLETFIIMMDERNEALTELYKYQTQAQPVYVKEYNK